MSATESVENRTYFIIQRRVRRKIQIQRSWNQELVGSRRIFLRIKFPKTSSSRTTSNFTPPGSKDLTGEENPLILGAARSDPLQCARGKSLQEEGRVADSSGADRDAGEDFWCMSGHFSYRHRVSTYRVISPNAVKKKLMS